MPTTSWQSAFREIMQPLGYEQFTTTTNLTTNNSVISTQLAARQPVDDYYIGWYVLIRGSNNDEVVRRITDYVASSGTLTVAGPVLDAESGTQTCELVLFDPIIALRIWNRGRSELFPHVAMLRNLDIAGTAQVMTGQRQHVFTLPSAIRDGPIQVWERRRQPVRAIAENEVTDPSFENWTDATTSVSWTLSGTNATQNQEQQVTNPKNYMVLEGGNSARLLTADSGATTYLQTVTPTVAVQGAEANVSVWVYCLTSGRVAARCGSTDGSTHQGTGWELLTATENGGSGTTTISVGVSVTAGAVLSIYVDEIALIVGQSEPIDYGWTPLLNWSWLPAVAGASNGGLLYLPYHMEQQQLRIVGKDLLSSLSADSDTVELGSEYLEPMYDYVRDELCRMRSTSGTVEDRAFWLSRATEHRAKWQGALATGNGRSPTPNPFLKVPSWGR